MASSKKTRFPEVSFAHVNISRTGLECKDDELVRACDHSELTFMYEFDTPTSNEFFSFTVTPKQLFTWAAKAGILSATVSGTKRVPAGLSGVTKVIAEQSGGAQ